MKVWCIFLAVVAIILFLFRNTIFDVNQEPISLPNWTVGGLYSIKAEDEYVIVKIIEANSEGVYLKAYDNLYKIRPDQVDPDALKLSANPSNIFGMRYLPITRKWFSSMTPLFIVQQHLSQEEIDHYNKWQKSNGEFFEPSLSFFLKRI